MRDYDWTAKWAAVFCRGPFFICEVAMLDKIESAEERIRALTVIVNKAKEVDRIPVKDDFTPEEVFLIKKHFGPLPRAMEAAGLKEVSETHLKKIQRRREKRKNR